MKLSVIMTSHNRPYGVLRSVLASLSYFAGNDTYDELVIVNDRGTTETIEEAAWSTDLAPRIIQIEGPPGRRCPSAAWNAGFRAATGTHFLCISSDTVLIPYSVQRAREFAELLPEMVVFGRAEHCGRFYYNIHKDGETSKTISHHFRPKPLGFVWMVPREAIEALNPYGYDEAYMEGFCYEDDDIMIRLLKARREFLFSDDICGFHIEHSRGFLTDEAGLLKTQANELIFNLKWGNKNALRDAYPAFWRMGASISFMTDDRQRAEHITQTIANFYTAECKDL